MLKNMTEVSATETEDVVSILKDKYRDKAVKFYEKDGHYDLIFTSEFESADQSTAVYADLLVDMKDADKTKEIHVWINSQGGDCSTLMLIDQQLDEFEYVVTIGTGEIDSAGFMLWLKGDERYLSPKTFCMYHGLSTGMFGKADEMKDFGSFIERYQTLFEESAKGILTDAEIEKGRYTEVWILGQELINRGVALPFKKYSERTVPVLVEAYKIGDSAYFRDDKGTFHPAEISAESYTKKELMKMLQVASISFSLDKACEELGHEFTSFFNDWISMKARVINGDGWISNSCLLEDWECFSEEKLSLDELKAKIARWVEIVGSGLKFDAVVVKGKRNGFSITSDSGASVSIKKVDN